MSSGWKTKNILLKKQINTFNARLLSLTEENIQLKIENLNLKWVDKCVILASLIYALDSVDSTLGHYVAYLSEWSPRSYKDMILKLPTITAIVFSI